jgi:hypothetical protein
MSVKILDRQKRKKSRLKDLEETGAEWQMRGMFTV